MKRYIQLIADTGTTITYDRDCIVSRADGAGSMIAGDVRPGDRVLVPVWDAAKKREVLHRATRVTHCWESDVKHRDGSLTMSLRSMRDALIESKRAVAKAEDNHTAALPDAVREELARVAALPKPAAPAATPLAAPVAPRSAPRVRVLLAGAGEAAQGNVRLELRPATMQFVIEDGEGTAAKLKALRVLMDDEGAQCCNAKRDLDALFIIPPDGDRREELVGIAVAYLVSRRLNVWKNS